MFEKTINIINKDCFKTSTTISSCFFTALHAVQTRSSDEKAVCPSVRPSVCLSVKRVHCDKT